MSAPQPIGAPLGAAAVAPTAQAAEKLTRLRAILRDMGSVVVCYSGGIDSAFVLAVAHDVLGPRAIGMTAVGPALAGEERDEAARVAAQIGARHELVASAEIDDPDYVKNDADRCFFCKSELYRVAARKQREWGAAHVVNGTNTDDLGDYRPGLDAAKEAGARSPLVEAGFSKADVRACAQALGLSIWDKPAAACLASRLPYGTAVTRGRLTQVAALEGALKKLGLRQVRVRWHAVNGEAPAPPAPPAPEAGAREAAIARIEVPLDELARAVDAREAIVRAGKDAGFAYVTLDLGGYRTGSHNEVLAGRSLRVLGQ